MQGKNSFPNRPLRCDDSCRSPVECGIRSGKSDGAVRPLATEGAANSMRRMHPNENFPDPWLYDTDALIKDLDYVRELLLKIPLHNDTHLPTNTAISALWDLRERLFFLAAMQREKQREWGKRGQDTKAPAETTPAKPARKVTSIRRASAA